MRGWEGVVVTEFREFLKRKGLITEFAEIWQNNRIPLKIVFLNCSANQSSREG